MKNGEYSNIRDDGRFKKKRLQNACDTCKERKVKCDSAKMPGNVCTNCIQANLPCLHTEPVRKRGPKAGYIHELEDKIRALEAIIRKNNMSDQDSPAPGPSLSPPIAPSSIINSEETTRDSNDTNDDDDFKHIDLSAHFKKMDISTVRDRFYGPSSGFMLVNEAIQAKRKYAGEGANVVPVKPQALWDIQPWEVPSAEQVYPHYDFPPDDLMGSLVDLYFRHSNLIIPIIHEPSFRRSIASGFHFTDHHFGTLLLAVCALGSKFSDDPRVLVDGCPELSSGWKWFDQIQIVRKSMFHPPTLYEIQVYCVLTIYVDGTSAPQGSWILISLGLRHCQELGLHRRKPQNYTATAEDEMKKRVFWILLAMDNLSSSFVGRPTATKDEDYDAEMPADCDDEYWSCESSSSDPAFSQPAGQPSLVSYFNCHLKLIEILAYVMRSLYSIKKSKLCLGLVGVGWEQRTVANLDSALNGWLDQIPEHLRWDPQLQNELFFDQSCVLYCTYYMVRMQIHRPFIQRASEQRSISCAMSFNAARACSHVLEAAMRRGRPAYTPCYSAAFIAGLMLLIHMFGVQKEQLNVDVSRDMADTNRCLEYLQMSKKRWNLAGRLEFLLRELSCSRNITLSSPQSQSQPSTLDASALQTNLEMGYVDFGMSPSLSDQALPSHSLDELFGVAQAQGYSSGLDWGFNNDASAMPDAASMSLGDYGWESFATNMLGSSSNNDPYEQQFYQWQQPM